ncbi:phage virion morphogenesis protein [Desulfuromonas thiophila]|uniref:phage virion morphogenesis protein n=1 Tax=Desulfuromonas thiophila TaxID=57664 RepID=UPI0024A8E522|nr:phage virion morphogenesis protein [Desulfuromonas thiophila]
MAGTNIKIELKGAQPLQAALAKLLQRTGDLSPALRDIGEFLHLAHDERFEKQQSPDG